MIGLLLAAGLVVPADTVYRGDAGELRVEAARAESPAVRVDGVLEEPSWAEASVLTGFTRYEPSEGVPALEETEVRVMYGPDAVYFGVVAHDGEPERIRASLTERDDGVTNDDWVRITLDTFNDNSQAYVFYVNPRGIQADGLWVEGAQRRFGPPIDFAPDFLWESSGRLTETGWVAEIRIPFVSLRFRDAPEQTWGLNVNREIYRTEYKSSWAPLTADAANQLELNGRLVGIRGLEPRRLVELNPVATGKRTGALSDAGELVREDFEPAFGLNARLGLTPNLVLDATVNPDFSQVEADAGQVAVNERFALFFPEKRPFFLEGTEVFNTPQRLVYTRAIVDPVGGAKLTGKVGAFNVGYLGAVDESPITFDEASDRAAFNLVRLRGDVGRGSTVGALYTDRTLLDGSAHNRVGSLDARLLFGERYTLTAQLAGAWSRELDDEHAEDLFGPLFSAQLSRSGQVFSWEASIEDVHPEFRARSGFIRRVGDTQVRGETRYTFLNEPGAWLEDWGPQLEFQAYYDHDELWAGRSFEEARLEAGFDVSLRGSNGFNLRVTDGYFSFDPDEYGDYRIETAGGTAPFAVPDRLEHLLGVQLFGRARPVPWLSLRGRIQYGEVPIYSEATRGVELSLGPTASLRFPMGFAAELSFNYSRIERAGGGEFSVARIPRTKLQYQFTKALFVRAIVQYDLQQRDALRHVSGSPLVIDGAASTRLDEGELQYDLLVSYEPSPGTIVYAGWSRLREGSDTYRFGELEPTAEGLFVKVSYLFRL